MKGNINIDIFISAHRHRVNHCLTLVPDGILRGVDLRPILLPNPGQSCGSGHLGSFTGSMAVMFGTGAALHHLGPAIVGLRDRKAK